MRHDFSKILTLYYIAINLEISDFEMSDKFLDPSIASHEVLLYLSENSIETYAENSAKIAQNVLQLLAEGLGAKGAFDDAFNEDALQAGYKI